MKLRHLIATISFTICISVALAEHASQELQPYPSGVPEIPEEPLKDSERHSSQIKTITISSSDWPSDITLFIHALSVPNGLLGVLLFLSGVGLCFFGIQNVRATTFLIGAYLFYLAGYVFITLIIWTEGYGEKAKWQKHEDWIYFSLMTVTATIGGIISMAFMKFALLALGAIVFFVLGSIVLIIGLGTVVCKTHEALVAFYLAMTTFGMVMVKFQEQRVLLFGLSLLGSMAIFLGLDVFIRSGFVEVFVAVVLGHTRVKVAEAWWTSESIAPYTITDSSVPLAKVPRFVWLILVCSAIIATFGCFVQTLPKKSNNSGPPRPKPAPASWWPWASTPAPSPPLSPKEPPSWWNGDFGSGLKPK